MITQNVNIKDQKLVQSLKILALRLVLTFEI